jgi:hypothetical protein
MGLPGYLSIAQSTPIEQVDCAIDRPPPPRAARFLLLSGAWTGGQKIVGS